MPSGDEEETPIRGGTAFLGARVAFFRGAAFLGALECFGEAVFRCAGLRGVRRTEDNDISCVMANARETQRICLSFSGFGRQRGPNFGSLITVQTWSPKVSPISISGTTGIPRKAVRKADRTKATMKITAIGQQLHILAVDVGPENVNIGPLLHQCAHDCGADILLEVDADERGPLKKEAELVRRTSRIMDLSADPDQPTLALPISRQFGLEPAQVSQDDAGVLKQGKAGRCRCRVRLSAAPFCHRRCDIC